MLVFAILIFGMALIVTIFKPIAGIGLAWLGMWMYPNRLFYNLLPLNIRLDDLLLVAVTFICVFTRHKGRMGFGVVLASLWFSCMTLGNLSGMMVTGGIGAEVITKNILKTLYVPLMAMAISSQIQTHEDIKKVLWWLTFASCATAVLGILTVYLPSQTSFFFIEESRVGHDVVEIVSETEAVARRARGSIGIVAMAGVLLTMFLLTLPRFLHETEKSKKIWLLLFSGLLGVGLIYTQSRSSLGAVAIVFLLWILFSKNRKPLIVIALVGLVVALVAGDLWQRIIDRFISGVGASDLKSGIATRMAVWNTVVQHWSVIYFVSGMGMVTVRYLTQATAHNAYLGAFVYTGIFGLFVMVLIIAASFRLSSRLYATQDSSPTTRALAMALRMLMVAYLFSGLFIENFQGFRWVQLLLAVYVIAEKQLSLIYQEDSVYELEYEPPYGMKGAIAGGR